MSPEDRELEFEAIDRMDQGLPARSPAEAETQALYKRLIARIRDLEDFPPPPGWEERMMARWRRERTR